MPKVSAAVTKSVPKPNTKAVRRLAFGLLTIFFVVLLGFLLSVSYRTQSITCGISIPRQKNSRANFLDTHQPRDCVILEKVTTTEQHNLGLSNRAFMSNKQGMLFVFDQSTLQCMWMKDMRFNLDIIWLDESKKIVKIEKNISPSTYPKNFCATARYVVELNSGIADSANLQIGRHINL